MRTRSTAILAVAACLMLTGCPQVKSVTGRVTALQWTSGMFPTEVENDLHPGSKLSVNDYVTVPRGSSITITVDGTDKKPCELTYTSSFFVVEPVDCKKQKEENEKKQQEKEQEQQQEQQQGQEQQGGDQQGAQSNGANGSGNSSGIGAPQVVPTSVPQYPGPGLGGPQVIATAVPQYTAGNFVAVGTNLVEALVGIAVVKKAGDKLDDNRDDKPVSP